MKKNKTSIKATEEGTEFLKRFCTNRRKADTDEKDLAYWALIEVIARYLKEDNDTYLKLVKFNWEKKNV